MSKMKTGLVFDVATVLGLGPANNKPLPEASPGEIILRIPKGVTLQSLRHSDVGKKFMRQHDWYDDHDWAKTALPFGTYCIRLPIPESNRKSFSEQQSLLLEGETVPPVALTAIALLCCKSSGHPDPLKNGLARCMETQRYGGTGAFRVVLRWRCWRLHVLYGWDGYLQDNAWAAGVRKIA